MPEWKIHNKWAERMGISREMASYVNSLIDFPEKSPEYMDFWMKHFTDPDISNDFYNKLRNKDELGDEDPLIVELCRVIPLINDIFDTVCYFVKFGSKDHKELHKMSFLEHDGGRNNPFEAYLQLKFLSLRGNEYVKAWYLHHFLDYISYGHFSSEEVFERLRNTLIYCPEFDAVKSFVRNHWEEIIQDLGYLRDDEKV